MEMKRGLEYYLKDYSSRDEGEGKCVEIIKSYISGGDVTYEQIDKIKDYPNAIEARICGFTQDTFDYFIENYGHQFKVIHFWKCPLISDLSKLEQLIDIEYLIFFWNQRATHLWDLSKNQNLKGLSFDDFTRMHTLDEIPLAPALEELHFGNAIWSTYILESLKPLCYAKELRNLTFSAKKINDNDITPLAKISTLKELWFPPKLFTTEQVAWLTANTKDLNSSVLAPYIKLTHPLECGKKKKDVLVVGKGKPFLDSEQDKTRLEKYEKDFMNLVDKYRREDNVQ